MLSENNIQKVLAEFENVRPRYYELLVQLQKNVVPRLTNIKSQEYLTHGVSRRLKIIRRCIRNIFHVFCPSRVDLLSQEELEEICINLHAFYVNIFGLLDNLAWVIRYEKQSKINRHKVGLYSQQFKNLMTKGFSDYLDSTKIKNWHDAHLKNYRDALSHRIPLYVPPYDLIVSTGAVRISSCFTHSVIDADETGRELHVQLLTDFNTIYEIINKFCEFEL